MTLEKIAVLGLGRVGALAAELLVEAGLSVVGVDQRAPEDASYDCLAVDVSNPDQIGPVLDRVDAVLSCLPYHLNIDIATQAHEKGIHYFDLTEDVPTTAKIIELAKTATSLMAPQCGLAPGLVGIVASDLIESLDSPGCEESACDLPEHPVVGRVHHDDRAHLAKRAHFAGGLLGHLLIGPDHDGVGLIREVFGAGGDPGDVGMTSHRPERLKPLGAHLVKWLTSQLLPRVVGRPLIAVSSWRDEVERIE